MKPYQKQELDRLLAEKTRLKPSESPQIEDRLRELYTIKRAKKRTPRITLC